MQGHHNKNMEQYECLDVQSMYVQVYKIKIGTDPMAYDGLNK